jgi:hypothetical protein
VPGGFGYAVQESHKDQFGTIGANGVRFACVKNQQGAMGITGPTQGLEKSCHGFDQVHIACNGLNNHTGNFLAQLTPFFVSAIGGYLVIKGDLSFGSLVAVLGRVAAYTGQKVSFDFLAKESKLDLFPKDLTWESSLPKPEFAIPGRTKLV